MKQLLTLILLFALTQNTIAQNVGIGTTTPNAFLNVADSKTVLFGADSSGKGKKLIWYASKGAFRAGWTEINEWDIGYVGQGSFAGGYATKAQGDMSMAMGKGSKAMNPMSTALGSYSNASGNISTAIGYVATAPSYIETAIGSWNTLYTPTGADRWVPTDRLFTIGNGNSDLGLRSDAMVILKNGNTGISVSNPQATLQVGADKTVLFGADTSGGGSKLIWYGSKSALRAGLLDANSDKWDFNNIGKRSFSFGYNSQASGTSSTAMGESNMATGNYSFTAGAENTASGGFSTALGDGNTASGLLSTALGRLTTASGSISTAIGALANASGDFSTAIGYATSAPSFAETTLGSSNTTYTPLNTLEWNPSDRLFNIGNGNPDESSQSDALVILKNGNTGFGSSNPTKKFEVVSLGATAPTTLVIGNRVGFGPAAMEFVSDYGTGSQWRPGYIQSNDAGGFTGKLEFYTNGTGSTTLYNSVKGFEVTNGKAYTATGTVFSFSDARLKNNITPFTDGLNVISKINPVNFYYNADAPFKTAIRQTGIVAQELEQVAPYMVEKNKEAGYGDLRSVNNQAYTFLLINAVKEQQAQIEKQQKEIQEMKRDNLEMKRQINKLSRQK